MEIREALRDLIDAIPEETLVADPPLRVWVNQAEEALAMAAPTPPSTGRPQTLADVLGRCLCGMPAVKTIPVLKEGFSLSVCERHSVPWPVSGEGTGPWETAALLKDRTRQAIRDRVAAEESIHEVAEDYGVPVAFVEMLVSFQLGRAPVSGEGTPPPEAGIWEKAALLQDRTRLAIRDRHAAGEDVTALALDYLVPIAFVEMLVSFQLGREPVSGEGAGTLTRYRMFTDADGDPGLTTEGIDHPYHRGPLVILATDVDATLAAMEAELTTLRAHEAFFREQHAKSQAVIMSVSRIFGTAVAETPSLATMFLPEQATHLIEKLAAKDAVITRVTEERHTQQEANLRLMQEVGAKDAQLAELRATAMQLQHDVESERERRVAAQEAITIHWEPMLADLRRNAFT